MEDLVKPLLGVDYTALTYQAVEKFFVESRVESNFLEFKSFHERSNPEDIYKEIVKAACAFLNSEGGVLIWGAPVETKVDGKSQYILPLTPVQLNLEKDFLINKISGNIIPMPKDIMVSKLPCPNGFIYLFQIQKSSFSPHQTDNRYYMRLDGQKKIAPHHYIEALFKQIKFPTLGGYIKFDGVHKYLLGKRTLVRLSISVVLMNHSPLQNEEQVSFRLLSDHGMILGIGDRMPNDISDGGGESSSVDPSPLLHYGQPEITPLYFYFDISTMQTANFKCSLILFFSGRFSPLKTSEYKLDLGFWESLPFNETVKRGNEAVAGRSENNLMSDLKYGGNLTEQEQLDILLER